MVYTERITWERRWCDVGSVRTHYAVTGQAGRSPIVLLHGIGRSLEDWSETALLARDYRLYALDLVGFGYTEKPEGAYTLAYLAQFVHDFLVALDETGSVVLIGNSLGGAVAQTFAVAHPERTRGLVLVASAGFGKEVILTLRLITVPGLGELLMRPSRRSARGRLESLFHDPRFITESRVTHTLSLAQQPGAARAFLATARNLGTWRGIRRAWRDALTQRLTPLQIPTLLIWGENDQVLPAQHLEAAAQVYPHAQTHLFRETGHAPQLERADEFNALIREFLEDV